jgi:hypothetical protein
VVAVQGTGYTFVFEDDRDAIFDKHSLLIDALMSFETGVAVSGGDGINK